MSAYRATLTLALSCFGGVSLLAQGTKPRPEDTEVWTPVPRVVTPGRADAAPPTDAVMLFDGHDLDQWVSVNDHSPAHWTVSDGVITSSM